jgi:hypothetical protein
MIRLGGTARAVRVWSALLDLADVQVPWVVVGARMVELHALEHQRVLGRASFDGDAMADARVRPNPVRRLAQVLVESGFELTDVAVMGTGHTFRRGDVEIDLLAPESLGASSEQARTTIPPLHTVEVPGGRQALDRAEWVEVQLEARRGRLPRPNLLGAILLKVRAVDVDDAPDNQRRDLALLLSLVDDPDELTLALHGQERGWLRRRTEMNREDAECWTGIKADDQQRGLSALRVLGDL